MKSGEDAVLIFCIKELTACPMLGSPPLTDSVAIVKTPHISVFVIPAKAGSQCFLNALHYWMPDQVRHDGQKLSDF